MGPQLGLTPSTQKVPKNGDGFDPMEDCIKVCRCLSHCLHRGSLCAGRYTLIEIVADECAGIQCYMSD